MRSSLSFFRRGNPSNKPALASRGASSALDPDVRREGLCNQAANLPNDNANQKLAVDVRSSSEGPHSPVEAHPSSNEPSMDGLTARRNPVVIDLDDDDDDDDDEDEDLEFHDALIVLSSPSLSPEPVRQPHHSELPNANEDHVALIAPVLEHLPEPAVASLPKQANLHQERWADMAEDDFIFAIGDGDFNDETYARALALEFESEGQTQDRPPSYSSGLPRIGEQQPLSMQKPGGESRVTSIDHVLAVFPGICRDYVSELYDTVSSSSGFIIAQILDKVETGTAYPTAKDTQRSLKRKRELDEDEELARKYCSALRVIPDPYGDVRPYT